jgi:2-phosphoglycerate kinase
VKLESARGDQSVIFLSGASGTGKSTRAEDLAAELGPRVRIISTDVIRAELRAVLSSEQHPDLWAESFNVPVLAGDSTTANGVNIDGFLRQCTPILRCVEAAVAYGTGEGWNLIVEGVHLVPGLFELPDGDELYVIHELHIVEDEDLHREMFVQRDRDSGGRRPADHYHANLARIHDVQAFLVDRWEAKDSSRINTSWREIRRQRPSSST